MPDRTIAAVNAALGTIAPFQKAAGWDPVGLQVGDPGRPVRRTAVCHEVTDKVLSELEGSAVDLVVSYHPLLFEPTTRLVAGPSAAGRAYRLIRAGMALAVVHTAFDVAPGGAADALAVALGLSHLRGIGPVTARDAVKIVTYVPEEAVEAVTRSMADAGAGRIGNYTACSFRAPGFGTFFAGTGTSPTSGSRGELNVEPESRLEMFAPRARADAVVEALVSAHPYEEPAFDVYEVTANQGFVGRVGRLPDPIEPRALADAVSDELGSPVRVALAASTPVQTVAVVPGSGSGLVSSAANTADVLITGDVSHHRAREAVERGLTVIDAGHAPTERPGVAKLYAAVAELGPCLDLTAADPGPWEEPA